MASPPRIYFDVNMCLDVFEQKPELFPALEALVKSDSLELLVSDLDLTEILKGNHLPTFTDGINRLLSLSPKWVYLTGLAAREVEYEHAIYHGKQADHPFMVFDTWPEFLPLITSQEERDDVSADLQIPTAAALLELYPPSSVAERLKEKWKPELKELGKGFPEMLKKAQSRENIFCEATAHTFGKKPAELKTFCDLLWNDPDHAPAYRLDLELTMQTLDTANPKWKNNDFLDVVHVGALPYVDIFVTQDGPLMERLAWYDDNVRAPRNKAPYLDRVCTTWEQFIEKVAASSPGKLP